MVADEAALTVYSKSVIHSASESDPVGLQMIRIDPRRNPTCRTPTWIVMYHLLSDGIGLRRTMNNAKPRRRSK
ncbi:hypothetical protein Y032_0311g2157 [Ancylostoma ceylanicum]|uniref:Uncharacterized protein n=1 Tax=Ancylostoma ceylanicum TaxID=53326 RepID=A0A016S2L0_9BILA|nr:hypothetical protein Y032_0311g2157 [Ancylostoma ceylanicum]